MSLLVKASVNIYILKGQYVLLSRRKDTGWLDGWLCAPGGHVEENETPIQAMIREVKEELGLTLSSEELKFICVAARNAKPTQFVAYEFLLKYKDHKIHNNEPDKCSELVWAHINSLPEDIIEDFKDIIQKSIIGNEKYLELGF